ALLLLVSLALLVLPSSGTRTPPVVEGGAVVVPTADCSGTVIGRGKKCEHRKCEAECRRQHDGIGACAAMGCSCAFCVRYPPSSVDAQANRY
uniref:Defensin-like protein n=1 Tax=Triticum urartu TaxID=4572 RepID=A0A8R7JVR6_TRIUA